MSSIRKCRWCGTNLGDSSKEYCCKTCEEMSKDMKRRNALNKDYNQIRRENEIKDKKLRRILMKTYNYSKYQENLKKYEAEKSEIKRTAKTPKEYEQRITEAARRLGI